MTDPTEHFPDRLLVSLADLIRAANALFPEPHVVTVLRDTRTLRIILTLPDGDHRFFTLSLSEAQG